MRIRRPALVVVAAICVSTGAVAQSAAQPAREPVSIVDASVPPSLALAVAKHGTATVVVVLKSDVGVTSPDTRANHARHASALAAVQVPVFGLLSAHHARKVHAYASFGEIAATVDAATLTALSKDPAVAAVVPDATVRVADPTVSRAGSREVAGEATAARPTSASVRAGVCATKRSEPQLNPEALQTTHTDSDDPTARTARSLGATGAGVRVAFFAEGIDVDNPDFIRPDGSKVFIDYRDFTGDGTSAPSSAAEAFLDASSLAAQGREVYNVKNYSALSGGTNCYIRIEGVSPGVSLVGLKVFGNSTSTVSTVLAALDYAVNIDHVDILSESLGINSYPDTVDDAFRQADAAAVASGVTVVASTGDAGVADTVDLPADQPGVIAAGASTTYRVDLQTGNAALGFPGIRGYLSNNISALSSSGEDEAGNTVSLVAPGDLNWDLCTPDPKQYESCVNDVGKPTAVTLEGGTSEAAPLVAGGAALVIEAFRSTHHGASPTPAQVQKVLLSTADDIHAPADQQGTGELDTYRAVLAARTLTTGRASAHGNTFITDTGQIDRTAQPGTAVAKTVRITNTGRATEQIHATQRALGAYRFVARTSLTLTRMSPTELDQYGLHDRYTATHFMVPAHTDRLDASIAFTGGAGFLTLVDPHGNLAGDSLPEGPGNHGDTEVADPVAGRWTAYVYTLPLPGSPFGHLGTYQFGARVADFAPFGSVSPTTLTLAPGTSGALTVHDATPSAPGDQAASVVLSSDRAGGTTIPVILRSLAATSGAAASFHGTLTGGNGRAPFTGQTAYYEVTVAKGTPELNATVTLAGDPDNPFSLQLVDPHGDGVGNASNLFDPGRGKPTPQLAATAHVLAPAPGQWTVIVIFAPTVSGKAITEPFAVSLDGRLRRAAAIGLPHDASTILPAGKARVVDVRVTNADPSPEAIFVDPRLDAIATYGLAGASREPLMLPSSPIQTYVVPSNSVELTESLTSSVPVEFDGSPLPGDPAEGADDDPDLESNTVGNTAGLTYQAMPIESGQWGETAAEIGPFGPAGAPRVNATASASVQALAFDTTATSPTGDLWLRSVDPEAVLTTVVVQPGKTATIPVTITPTGPRGTRVSGALFIDDLQEQNQAGESPQADQQTALPYSYTVG